MNRINVIMPRLVQVLCVLGVCIFFALVSNSVLQSPARQLGVEAPYFTWGAMQRFWNKMCSIGLEMENITDVPTGHVINYGRGVVIHVNMKGERVRSLRLVFDDNIENGGGQLFLRTVQTALKVGTYGWPESQALEAMAAFDSLSMPKREFVWGATRFIREGHEDGVLSF